MQSHSNHPYRVNQKEPYTFILIVMSSFSSMGVVTFAPEPPEITQYFEIS